MILAVAIIKIAKNLEDLSRKDGKSVSTNEDVKKQGLECLLNILCQAPDDEFKTLIESCDNDKIIIGYLLNVLCNLAKHDKSREVKTLSVETIKCLVERLGRIHSAEGTASKCSLGPVVTALPGVCSTFFQLIMSDTKLPKSLLTLAIKTLSTILITASLPCKHSSNRNQANGDADDFEVKLTGHYLNDICDNLAPRIDYLVDYVMNNSEALAHEVKLELLDFCNSMIAQTRVELLTRTLNSIVKYTAFMTSEGKGRVSSSAETQVKVMLILDNIRYKLENCDSQSDRLDSVVFECLFKVLNNLENHGLKMLSSERKSELSMLSGLLQLLSRDMLNSVIEVELKRQQILETFIKLTEFSSEPILFITGTHVDASAIVTRDVKIQSMEKKFRHIDEVDASLIRTCCSTIGQNLDWTLLVDIIKSELCKFSNSSNLHLTNLLVSSLSQRTDLDAMKVLRFTHQTIDLYVDTVQEECTFLKQSDNVFSDQILRVVIAIECLAILVGLHIKYAPPGDPRRILILRNMICPLLNWCASSNRAVSEASLSTLNQISQLYGHQSTKSFVEHNIDYVVNGVGLLLDNFCNNTEVTNVLAVTFKLTSMKTFCYFRDIYEKIFRILGTVQFSDKSKPIALLFYRTLAILDEWQIASNPSAAQRVEMNPLATEAGIAAILHELDIDRRIRRLRVESKDAEFVWQQMTNPERDQEAENKVIQDIQTGRVDDASMELGETELEADEERSGTGKKKPDHIVLTEKILGHCIALMTSHHDETRIHALRATARGFNVLQQDEDTLLPMVHKLWTPLTNCLNRDYQKNLEVNLSAFECLISMASNSRDFIKRRTLESIVPKLCLFLESQARASRKELDHGPYAMTTAYKCQLRILNDIGSLAYHIQLNYSSLWRIIKSVLSYLEPNQMVSLRKAAVLSLHYLIGLDADCVYFFAKQSNCLHDLPFHLIYKQVGSS